MVAWLLMVACDGEPAGDGPNGEEVACSVAVERRGSGEQGREGALTCLCHWCSLVDEVGDTGVSGAAAQYIECEDGWSAGIGDAPFDRADFDEWATDADQAFDRATSHCVDEGGTQ